MKRTDDDETSRIPTNGQVEPVGTAHFTSAPSIRLLTFNIAHGRGLAFYQGFQGIRKLERNLDRIAALLRSSGAHIVALQEVDQDSHWNKRLDLLEYLRIATGFENASMSIHNRREGRRPLAYGNALLARYPVQTSRTYAFGSAALGEKGFHYTEIETPTGILPLLNLHLDFRSRRRRIEQIEQVIAFLADKSATQRTHPIFPPVICGDFNSTSKPARDAVAHLFRYLGEHAHYQIWPKAARTFPAHFPSRALDFIFLPQSFEVRSCQVIRSFTSDHLPVLVDFRCK